VCNSTYQGSEELDEGVQLRLAGGRSLLGYQSLCGAGLELSLRSLELLLDALQLCSQAAQVGLWGGEARRQQGGRRCEAEAEGGRGKG
jgi:hypothetical protein